MEQLKRVQRILMAEFMTFVLLSLFIVALYETGILTPGAWHGMGQGEFACLVVMELLTVSLIPLALRLFKFAWAERALKTHPAQSAHVLLQWGSCRLVMLGLPLVVNTLLYYLFMNATFCYMAIILFLSLFFVIPTLDRCVSETGDGHQDDNS